MFSPVCWYEEDRCYVVVENYHSAGWLAHKFACREQAEYFHMTGYIKFFPRVR